MNRGQLREAVKVNTGRNDKDSTINLALDLGLVQIAQRAFVRDVRKTSNLAIVASDLSVALPSDFYQFVDARLINGSSSFAMTFRRKKYFTDRWPSVTSYGTGIPTVFYIEGLTLFLAPKSSGSYTIRLTYVALPIAFVGDTTANPIRGSDLSLINWATAYTYDSIEQVDLGNFWRQRFEFELNNLLAADRRTNEELVRTPFGSGETTAPPEYWNDPFYKLK